MRVLSAVAILCLLCPMGARTQELTGTGRQRVLETARSRYYTLTGLGAKSFTCGVHFDLQTLSPGLLPPSDTADRALLQGASFTLKVTQNGPSVAYRFPDGAVSQSQDVVAGVTLWITEIVQGFFQTWPAKGLHGPIPRDREVEHVQREGDGYLVTVKAPGGTADLHLDKDLLVRRIVSRSKDAEVEERPAFTANPAGLLFTGNESVSKDPLGVTQVRYGLEEAPVDGVLLPRSVHLVVGSHMDVRFDLVGCRVTMGKG
jgi:hypothetical protein